MNKKCQISIFIIIGIITILVIAFLLYITDVIADKNSLDFTPYPDVRNNIESAHKKSLECSSYTIGKFGGFSEFKDVGLAEIDNSRLLAGELMTWIISNIINLSSLEEKGYTIKQGKIKTDIILAKNNIAADTLHELDVVKIGSEKTKLEKFHVDDDIRYNHIYNYANAQHKEEDISLNNLADTDFHADVFVIKNMSIFVFTDPESMIDQNPFKFIFWKK
ncbi:MAG: hypothetical protein ABIG89_03745 [Candidatus Woesearchaeota archaeon]